jgi:AcrR family transcriptional regulator
MASMSSTTGERTRTRIVAAADRLFYEAGYEHTSFAHIAAEVGISRGNFHHHFRTKDDILAEVIARRSASTAEMLDAWAAAHVAPDAQIGCFIDMVVDNRVDIMRFGCPVGSLCSELAKHDHRLLDDSGRIFEQFRDWLRERFVDLGFDANADELALHLLVLSQGVAVLANVHKDEAFLEREVAGMHAWLDELISTTDHP